jgi:hypothetical protein
MQNGLEGIGKRRLPRTNHVRHRTSLMSRSPPCRRNVLRFVFFFVRGSRERQRFTIFL